MENIVVVENALEYQDYCRLRESVKWMNLSRMQTEKVLKNILSSWVKNITIVITVVAAIFLVFSLLGICFYIASNLMKKWNNMMNI